MKKRKLNTRELVAAVLNTVRYSNSRLNDSLPAVRRISVSVKQKFLTASAENEDFNNFSDDYSVFIHKKSKRLIVELIQK